MNFLTKKNRDLFAPNLQLFLPCLSPFTFSYSLIELCNFNMKSNSKEDKNEFNNANEFGESSEDTSGFIESSSTLNNETSEHIATDNRLRSRKMQQQVSLIFLSYMLII